MDLQRFLHAMQSRPEGGNEAHARLSHAMRCPAQKEANGGHTGFYTRWGSCQKEANDALTGFYTR
jgi:hypothetical protein